MQSERGYAVLGDLPGNEFYNTVIDCEFDIEAKIKRKLKFYV